MGFLSIQLFFWCLVLMPKNHMLQRDEVTLILLNNYYKENMGYAALTLSNQF